MSLPARSAYLSTRLKVFWHNADLHLIDTA
jgi:hypothetical protein